MNFKNELEERCFEIANRVFGSGVSLEHNKTIRVETALLPEVASFKGPPAKEIDVLMAEVLTEPRIMLLVSCKLLTRKAEPAHVQEWCAVVQAMNKYSGGTKYFGIVLSPTGFTSGCEAWATSHNIGIVPPLKGTRLSFNEDTVYRMYERVLFAFKKRVELRIDDLESPPAFFDFVYQMVADFEGHQEVASGGRYYLVPKGWVSSFSEMYASVAGRKIEEIFSVPSGTVMKLAEDRALIFTDSRVEVVTDLPFDFGVQTKPVCWKNIEMEPCDLDLIRELVIGKTISSSGDFGSYIEFGVESRYNLGLHVNGFHIYSTENPIESNRL